MKFQSYEKLKLMDLESLLNYAKDFGYYAEAIYLLGDMYQMLQWYNLERFAEVHLVKRMKIISSQLVKLNNGYLEKLKKGMGRGLKMLPYIIDKHLKPKKKQPSYVLDNSVLDFHLDRADQMQQEYLFVQTCKNGRWFNSRLTGNCCPVCRYIHHKNPYLMLGPFKEDQISNIPYVVVFRDILSDIDIQTLIKEAQPNLSRKRTYDRVGGAISTHELESGKLRRIVHKTVQSWLSDVEWPPFSFPEDYIGKNYTSMINIDLWKLSKRISLATQMVTDIQTSGSSMQVTNYGLGGLCEQHIDPHGIMESDEQYHRKHRPQIYVHGDIMATFMAWLSDTEEGGATSYLSPGREQLIMPDKGSAAFWYDLNSDGFRDQSTQHAGCPILKGSKWILNKWLFWFDNFKKFPCNVKRKPFDPPFHTHYY